MSKSINQAYAMNQRDAALAKASFGSGLAGFGAIFGGVIATATRWQERAESRHALLKLDDRMLRDIGISRIDAAREADKPFWK